MIDRGRGTAWVFQGGNGNVLNGSARNAFLERSEWPLIHLERAGGAGAWRWTAGALRSAGLGAARCATLSVCMTYMRVSVSCDTNSFSAHLRDLLVLHFRHVLS